MMMTLMKACLRVVFRLKHDAKLASRYMDSLADLLVDLHLHIYKYAIQIQICNTNTKMQ